MNDLLFYLPYLVISLYSVILVVGGIWFGARLSARLWVRDERIVSGLRDAEIPDEAGEYEEDLDTSSS